MSTATENARLHWDWLRDEQHSTALIPEGTVPWPLEMDATAFEELVAEIPGGYRLSCKASWREVIFVDQFLQVLNEDPGLLETFLPNNTSAEERNLRLARRVCWGFVRWFGCHMGQALINALLARAKEREEIDDMFGDVWRNHHLHMHSIGGGQSVYISLDTLICFRRTQTNPFYVSMWVHDEESEVKDYACPEDKQVADQFIRWLDTADGLHFVLTALSRIDARRKAVAAAIAEAEQAYLDSERRDQIEIESAEHRAELLKKAGLSPA